MLTVVVTGGRDYADAAAVARTLDKVHAVHVISTLVHGAATGADTLAGKWAKSKGVPCKAVPVKPADWEAHGPAAGPKRNQAMLDRFKPDLLVAFPGGAGTADCVRRARKAGIVVLVVPP